MHAHCTAFYDTVHVRHHAWQTAVNAEQKNKDSIENESYWRGMAVYVRLRLTQRRHDRTISRHYRTAVSWCSCWLIDVQLLDLCARYCRVCRWFTTNMIVEAPFQKIYFCFGKKRSSFVHADVCANPFTRLLQSMYALTATATGGTQT